MSHDSGFAPGQIVTLGTGGLDMVIGSRVEGSPVETWRCYWFNNDDMRTADVPAAALVRVDDPAADEVEEPDDEPE